MFLNEYADVLNVTQVSEILAVSEKTVYKLIHEKRLEHIKVGRAYKIPKAHLLKFLGIMQTL